MISWIWKMRSGLKKSDVSLRRCSSGRIFLSHPCVVCKCASECLSCSQSLWAQGTHQERKMERNVFVRWKTTLLKTLFFNLDFRLTTFQIQKKRQYGGKKRENQLLLMPLLNNIPFIPRIDFYGSEIKLWPSERAILQVQFSRLCCGDTIIWPPGRSIKGSVHHFKTHVGKSGLYYSPVRLSLWVPLYSWGVVEAYSSSVAKEMNYNPYELRYTKKKKISRADLNLERACNKGIPRGVFTNKWHVSNDKYENFLWYMNMTWSHKTGGFYQCHKNIVVADIFISNSLSLSFLNSTDGISNVSSTS